MRFPSRKFGLLLVTLFLGAGLTVAPAFAGAKTKTFTGDVSDAMCGVKHGMGDGPADCTRLCAKKGSSYALVVGDKVYTLQAKDQATLDQLDKLAGAKAKISGTADGDTIEVSSVAPGQ